MPGKSRARSSTFLVHGAFVITGIVTTMLGPLLPLLSARWHLSDFQAGYFFTAQFLASLITAAISGILISRLGYRWTLFCSLILMAIGVAILDQKSWEVGMTAVCIYGAGFGLSTPTGNLLIAELNPDNRASALNLVNFSWGVGAVGAPVAIAMVQRASHTAWVTYAITVITVILSVCVACATFETSATGSRTLKASETEDKSAERKLYLGLVLCVLFFTYVGTEASIGGWIASQARRVSFGVGTFWALVPSVYWGALLLGRAAAPLTLRIVREMRLAVMGLLLALIGVAGIFAAHSLQWIAVGTGLAGLGMSSIFPANLSLLSQWFGRKAPRVGSLAFPSASLGGAILPWLVGLISTYAGDLRRGLIVPLLGVAVMLILYVTHSGSSSAEAS
jgi:fucose permease